LVRPSKTGACGAAVKVLETIAEGFPIFEDDPLFVMALMRKKVGAPAVTPVATVALVAVLRVFATTARQVVLFVLASIL
jgi:hypothetical protein